MSQQPYTDWEIVEFKDYGIYKYHIMKVIEENGRITYRGWMSSPSRPIAYSEGNAIKSDSLDAVRSALVTLGLQS